MSAQIIKAFLASVGFKADEKSLKSALAKVTAFGVGIKIVTAGVYAGLAKVAGAEEQLAVKAERLGTTADILKEQAYVAKQYGHDIDLVTSSMQALVDKNPRIKDGAKALEEVGARLKGMNLAGQRMFMNGLGLDRNLIPMLTSDTAKLRAEFKAMYDVAGVDGKRAKEASSGFLSEVRKLVALGAMLAKAVAVPLMESFRPQIESIRKVVFENFGTIRRVLELVIKAFVWLASVVDAALYRVIKIIGWLIDTFDSLDDGQKKLAVGATLLLAAWKLLNLGFLASPIGLVITALVALFVALDDLFTYLDGGESQFEDFWKAAFAAADYILAKWQALKDWFSSLWTDISAGAAERLERIKGVFHKIVAWIKAKFNDLTSWMPDWVREKLGVMVDAPEVTASAAGIIDQMAATHLTPSPAAQSAINNDNSKRVEYSSETNISVQTSDPMSAARMVGTHQDRVNAEAVRNLKAVAG